MQLTDFELPKQEDVPNAAKELSPPKFAAWLGALPAANPVETCQQLIATLRKLARIRLKPQHRHELLAALPPVADPVIEALVQQHLREALPLAERSQNLAALLRHIHRELALNHKIALRDWLEAGLKPKPREREFAASLFLALHHLAQTVVAAYSAYEPEMPRVWGEIHALYAFALEHQLHDVEHPVPGALDAATTTPDRAYRRIVMLGLSNPYHLMRGEARTVYRLLDDWGPRAVISPLRTTEVVGQPYVDLSGDAPPGYASTDRPVSLADGRSLDIRPVVKALDEQLSALMPAAGRTRPPSGMALADRLKRDLLLRLQRAWSARGERQHDRDQKFDDLEMVMGLSAAHHYLSAEAPFKPEEAEAKLHRQSSKQNLKELGPTGFQDWDPTDTMSGNRNSRFLAADPSDDIWYRVFSTKAEQEAAQLHTQYAPSRWQQKDRSEGGMSLFSAEAAAGQIQVGEVVALRTAGEQRPEAWQVGVVRWMIFHRGNGLDVGIKLLAASPAPVGARALSGTGMGSEYLRALIEPRDRPDSIEAELLVPAAIYDIGTEVLINMGRRLFYARLTRLLDASRCFHQFAFDVIAEPPGARRSLANIDPSRRAPP